VTAAETVAPIGAGFRRPLDGSANLHGSAEAEPAARTALAFCGVRTCGAHDHHETEKQIRRDPTRAYDKDH